MLFPKQKPKSRSRRKRVYGGAIFASVVFMVLSMMVILQNEKLLKWNAIAEASGKTVDQVQKEAKNTQTELLACRNQLSQKETQLAQQKTQWEKLLTIKDLDARLVAYLIPSEDLSVVVHRISPSGNHVAVVYGWPNQLVGLGFYVRDNDGTIFARDGIKGDVNHGQYIKNVRWQDENTILYDWDDGTHHVTHVSYLTPAP